MFNSAMSTGKLALPHSLRVRRVCERKYQKKEATESSPTSVVRDEFVKGRDLEVGSMEIFCLKFVGG